MSDTGESQDQSQPSEAERRIEQMAREFLDDLKDILTEAAKPEPGDRVRGTPDSEGITAREFEDILRRENDNSDLRDISDKMDTLIAAVEDLKTRITINGG